MTHGDYCLPNVFVDPETLLPTGILDVGELGVGDPLVDLAGVRTTLALGLNPQYGRLPSSAADGFDPYRYVCGRLGVEPDDPQIESYFAWYHSR